MENLIPLNGRIAIVDDKLNQALPLMRVFSKNNIPYTYYKGTDVEFLPEQPENDIRILFLDLNLFEGRDNQPKEIQSSLYSVIKRLISPNNYPYVLVLWSLQEARYKDLLNELFDNSLKSCAPIAIKNWIKSNFFSIETEEEVNKENEHKIIDELRKLVSNLPAYSYLMQWENHVHNSADFVLQDVFHDFHSQESWKDNANCILDLFAHSYLEKHYKNASLEDKAKASLLFLNDVFYDTLESTTIGNKIENAVELQYAVDTAQKDGIRSKINYNLLMSKSQASIKQPGSVFTGSNDKIECVKCSHSIINDSLNTEDLREQVKEQFQNVQQKEAKDFYNQLLKERKDTIYSTMIPCGIVVTPACDYAQNKAKYDRVIMGVIIDSCFKQFIDTKSEAIYISPSFNDGSQERILVLNYRYFLTQELADGGDVKPLFRVRNSMLAEIQSKLARHINRQGIMNL